MAFNIKFNNKALPSFVKVTGVSYSALPELQHSFQAKTSGVGLIDNGTQILGKTLKIDFVIIKDSRSVLQLSQELATWLMGNNFKLSPLVITDGVTVTYQAKVSNAVEITDAFKTGSGSIEFTVPTGVAESGVAPVSIQGGKITVNYTASAQSYPVITCTVSASTTMVGIQNSAGTARVTVYGAFTAGDKITFDCRNKRVKINNKVNMAGVALDSVWLSVPTIGTYNFQGIGTGTWACTVPLRYY